MIDAFGQAKAEHRVWSSVGREEAPEPLSRLEVPQRFFHGTSSASKSSSQYRRSCRVWSPSFRYL